MKLYEVLLGYENNQFKDRAVFLYQNNLRMAATFKRVTLFGAMTV